MLNLDEREFLREDITKTFDKHNCVHGCYVIPKFKLNTLTVDVELTHIYNRKRCNVTIRTPQRVDEDGDIISNILFDKNIDCEEENKYEKVVKFLCELREKYDFSKILNIVEEKDLIKYEEKKALILYKLCNGKEMEECCVCSDITKYKTVCNHTLCMSCLYKIEYSFDEERDIEVIACPICRRSI